jgi:hypothetical protein
LVALSLVIVVLYGSMVWYMFPDTEDGISWEGHLSGFATGLLLTLFLKAPEFAQKTYKYDWQHPDFDPQQDPFIKCFDENGNYIIIPKETLEERWKRDVRNPYRITLPVIYTKNTCGFDMV